VCVMWIGSVDGWVRPCVGRELCPRCSHDAQCSNADQTPFFPPPKHTHPYTQQFKQELAEKQAKLDTDPGLWMALTLAKESYTTLLTAKKTPEAESGPHWERMQAALKAFKAQVGGGGCVGVCKVCVRLPISMPDPTESASTSSTLLSQHNPLQPK
jgi:hypothetical protein